ncbi:MAG: pyruvate kinase alpha/beta domain-containing protein [Candidatus Bathyarchaeia archaeon]
MARILREDYYFDEPGEQNTDDVVEAVEKRLSATGIKYVVVASTRGKTAVKFAEALGKRAHIISVSEPQYIKEWGVQWPIMDPAYRKRLEELGVTVLDNAPYVFHSSVFEASRWPQVTPEILLRETFYTLGQGFKVAVEVVLTAVACGALEPYQDVIGVGGTSRGADTALVLRATYPATVFSKDPAKKLEIREIIAMPRKKIKEQD